jgi:hypothetical protein
MTTKAQVLAELSKMTVPMPKKLANHYAQMAIVDPLYLEGLFDLIEADNLVLARKAVWVLRVVSEEAPVLLQPYSVRVTGWVLKSDNDSIIRDALSCLLHLEWNEEIESMLLDRCYALCSLEWTGVAVKYNALKVLCRIVKKYPDLQPEFLERMTELYEVNPANWTRQAKRLVKESTK